MNILKTKAGMAIIGIIVIGLGTLVYIKSTSQTTYDTVKVTRADLSEEVSVSGRVKSARSVNLAFEKGGKVGSVYVKTGDRVAVGKPLVSIDASELLSLYRGAEANVLVEKSRLDEVLRGPRKEEVSISETKVKNAELVLLDKREALANTLTDAYTKSDDAVRNKTEKLFNNSRSSSPKFIPQIANSQLETTIETQRLALEQVLIFWRKSLDTMSLDGMTLVTVESKKNLEQVRMFLDNVAMAVNSMTPNIGSTQATIDGYRTDLITARNNINASISAVSGADGQVRSGLIALELAKNDLALLLSGNTSEQVSVQKSKYDQVVANAENYQAQIRKTIIYSPIEGVVTNVEAKVGEIFPANTVAVSVISASDFHIEVNVPEADISKILVGNTAEVTLDAYGQSELFPSVVILIDPAETIIDGVPTYKVTLKFTQKDARVRSGMTANITIKNNPHIQVLSVPSRVVFEKAGEKYVKVVGGKDEIIEKKVTTGIRSSNGALEIVSGLEEGEEVVFATKN